MPVLLRMRTELSVKPVDNARGSWFYYYFDLSLFSNGLHKVSRSQNHPKVDMLFLSSHMLKTSDPSATFSNCLNKVICCYELLYYWTLVSERA